MSCCRRIAAKLRRYGDAPRYPATTGFGGSILQLPSETGAPSPAPRFSPTGRPDRESLVMSRHALASRRLTLQQRHQRYIVVPSRRVASPRQRLECGPNSVQAYVARMAPRATIRLRVVPAMVILRDAIVVWIALTVYSLRGAPCTIDVPRVSTRYKVHIYSLHCTLRDAHVPEISHLGRPRSLLVAKHPSIIPVTPLRVRMPEPSPCLPSSPLPSSTRARACAQSVPLSSVALLI